MKSIKPLLTLLAFGMLAQSAAAFCGFYVAKADTKLFNEASKVVIVRDGDRTVLTMANDFQGDLKEFAAVFPVPTVLERGQINVTKNSLVDHLDAYTAPRLVEYNDKDPCAVKMMRKSRAMALGGISGAPPPPSAPAPSKLGVKIEAEYQVGEYDILILSAEQSDGLETWLKQEGYKMPAGASKVLGSYIKQNMKFFVAKVNLDKQLDLGYTMLRPLQVAYESKKFALPIRLGTVNAKGDQELFAFMITKKGRVECTNYKTVKLPSNMDVPVFVKDEFGKFYKDMFSYQCAKHNDKAVFMEYAWNMNWCDPCAADPLSPEQLRELGCFWVEPAAQGQTPAFRGGKSMAREAFVTRLHVRYNATNFPEDLVFQNTGDTKNYQGRYVLRHPWKGKADQCERAEKYFKDLGPRMEQRAENLVELTGWDLKEVVAKMDIPKEAKSAGPWWDSLWKDGIK